MDLEDWLRHIERLHPKTIALGLDRVRAVRDRLAVPKFVPDRHRRRHQRQGLDLRDARAHPRQRAIGWLYTSPDLVRFEERCASGHELDAAVLTEGCGRVEAAREGAAHLLRVHHARLVVALARAQMEAVVLEVAWAAASTR